MGEVHVDIGLANLTTGERVDRISALVDTGATLSIIPRPLLEHLRIHRSGFVIGLLADGREIVREVGNVLVTVDGDAVPCRVLFGEPDDVVTVGLTVLEMLGLAVDPARNRLVPGHFLI